MAVNDVADRETLAHLLKYDSTYGRFPAAVEAGDDSILVDGAEIKVFSEATRARSCGELDVDLVTRQPGGSEPARRPPLISTPAPAGDRLGAGEGVPT